MSDEPSSPETAAKVGALRFSDIPCSNATEYGVVPSGADFEIDREKAERIVAITSMLSAMELWKAESFDWSCLWKAPEDFAFADEDGAIKTEADTLCVSTTHFWFDAIPKHEEGSIETAQLSIADLARHFGLPFPAEPPREEARTVNANQLALLAAYPNLDLLPIDPSDPDGVAAVVENDATGDTLFNFLWRELNDAGEDRRAASAKLAEAIRDLEAVKAAIDGNPRR